MSEIAEVRRLCETPWSAVNIITNAEIALRASALLHEIDRLAALAPVQPVTDEATDGDAGRLLGSELTDPRTQEDTA